MSRRPAFVVVALAFLAACTDVDHTPTALTSVPDPALAQQDVDRLNEAQLNSLLSRVLARHGFTGQKNWQVMPQLGRAVNPTLADIGRLLFFDPVIALKGDNSCAGCHAPQHGFGDSQSIAIGIDNNGIVGPARQGPRNQRRSPQLLNAAFFPRLMWNSRFSAGSGNPFDNSGGFSFPAPEGRSLSYLPHLLTAQAFIPTVERVEMTGFDFVGDNDAIRAEVVRRVNLVDGYRSRFGAVFPEVRGGGPLTYDHLASAIAEFTFTLRFANAPIDEFARGNWSAMTLSEKRGALLFFGKARCVECHAVSGESNEMFSDFKEHVIALPQVAPFNTNVSFDGPGANEDFGLEQVTGDPVDRYAFRTSPIRNVALQPTFGHNGAYTRLPDMIRHHLNAYTALANYTPQKAGVAPDLWAPMAPTGPLLSRLDPRLQTPITLEPNEFGYLVDFVATGLLDRSARPDRLRRLIPSALPSGAPVHNFQ